jgi:hypothetical protein
LLLFLSVLFSRPLVPLFLVSGSLSVFAFVLFFSSARTKAKESVAGNAGAAEKTTGKPVTKEAQKKDAEEEAKDLEEEEEKEMAEQAKSEEAGGLWQELAAVLWVLMWLGGAVVGLAGAYALFKHFAGASKKRF